MAGLNTFQLIAALEKNPITKKCFDGVYPRDILKPIKKTPWMIIVNTDPSTKSGKHWILLYFDAWGMPKFLTLWVMMWHLAIPLLKNSSRDILLIICMQFMTEFNPKAPHSVDIIVCIMLILDVRGCLRKKFYTLCLPHNG